MTRKPGAGPLAKSLRGIREPRQRVLKLVKHIKEWSPETTAEFLMDLIISPKSAAGDLAKLHLDLVRHRGVLSLLGYEKISDVYAIAVTNNLMELKALLRSDRMFTDDFEQMPETFASRIDALTLGERKQISRYAERSTLETLLFDPDPMVIRELLLNPRVTERDVIRIAARHQAPPPLLEEILKSDKWMASYRVRKALVFNPNTPLSYASGLTAHLHTKDLKLLVQIRPDQKDLCEIAKKKLGAV